jgi:hypothetical protein
MGVFNYNSLLSSLCSMLIIILQLYNEGVYIPFPSCALKLSNLSIKFYLPTFITHKGSYLLWTRVDRSRSFYNNTSMPPLNDFINISKHFQKMCSVLFQLSLISALVSLLAMLACPCDAPASQVMFKHKFTGKGPKFPYTNK